MKFLERDFFFFAKSVDKMKIQLKSEETCHHPLREFFLQQMTQTTNVHKTTESHKLIKLLHFAVSGRHLQRTQVAVHYILGIK